MDTKDGKTCSVDLKLHACTAKSKGQIRYLATGWVWFNYNDRTHGHYKCILPFLCAFNGLPTPSVRAVYIDDILSNEDDRSNFAEIQGLISTETYSSSNAVCV
ncbi:hypothetical protein ARMSODRAFT_1019212 [Armillaria solidipes]|uniref:Uncharacterized protein n=1 Tax=Armillaria solidipes TaxID=1076256 RepID=A0A2H3BZA9_9AGAR|nr:hypothetical protein ARMSODRAFT_1019212 [Armillaria solidipes]